MVIRRSYLATDGQGTVSAALDSAGNVTSSQLYTPYGTVRYSSGASPTTLGYTGQRADGTTGLDYYQARYYDPTAGQFISADTADDGTNRYGYVHGNPTTASDPSGHRVIRDASDKWRNYVYDRYLLEREAQRIIANSGKYDTINPVGNSYLTEHVYISTEMARTFSPDLFMNDAGAVSVQRVPSDMPANE